MDVFEMKFSKVFPLLIAKAQRKGRTEDEVFAVTEWLESSQVQCQGKDLRYPCGRD